MSGPDNMFVWREEDVPCGTHHICYRGESIIGCILETERGFYPTANVRFEICNSLLAAKAVIEGTQGRLQ